MNNHAFMPPLLLTQEEDVSGGKIKRKIDGKQEINYTIPQNTIIGPGRSLKARWSIASYDVCM